MGGILYLLLFAISFLSMTQQPWLGVEMKETEIGSAFVNDVSEDSAASGIIFPGDIVRGIACGEGEIPFNRYSFIEDPEETPDYQSYHAFFKHQQALFRCLNSKTLKLVLSDRISAPITPQSSRPILEIPPGFWITHALGISTLIFGLGVWSHRRGEISSRLLVIWSISITFIVHSMTVYGFRELAIDADLFHRVHAINRFAVMLMSFTIFTLICYYPRRLSRFPYTSFLLTLGLLLALNEIFQIIEWPWHTFYFVSMLVYLTSFIMLGFQWYRSRQSAVNRAAVIWFMLSIVLANGGALVFYALPTVFGEEPLTSLWVGQGFFLLMFFGFALGVVRYRLFEIERWWLMTWVWFLGGLLVLLLDSLLILYLNLKPAGALSIAVLLVAWAYLPARQWLWQRLFKRNDYRLETYLPQFMDAQFSSSRAEDFNTQWPKFLAQVFHSADVMLRPGQLTDVRIDNNGCDLKIPTINTADHVVLAGKERGSRLFGSKDARLANGLYNLANQTMSLRMEREKAVNQERNRIMRDLHDDVGAKLLALVHLSESKESADIARQTLKSLREMVYAIRGSSAISLDKTLAKWREELMQRVASAGIKADWKQSDIPAINLTARQSINLGSIFREAVTNALKHADTSLLEIRIMCDNNRLTIIVSNNGVGQLPPKDWAVGAGRANMMTRAEEIEASIEWKLNPDKPGRVDVVVEMPTSKAKE